MLPGPCGRVACRTIGNMTEPIPFAQERRLMVEIQLRHRGIRDQRVLDAMLHVPRHEFVPPALVRAAYDDRPLPLGDSETISQPYIVAFMTEQLDPKPTDRVLEIGTGSGYQAAVLAQRAAADLKRLGFTNIQVRAGDGYQGWPEASPFDAVIVTCAPEKVPQPLVEQLKDGGRMIIPIGPMGDQELVLLHKQGGHLDKTAVLPVRFVPMTGQAQH